MIFSLTAAEGKLAKTLAAGHGIEAAASALSISRETVRAQLRAIFAKTNTKRQAELSALLARVSLPTRS
jgi:DNA-binding CsgD family transcriptional regulator